MQKRSQKINERQWGRWKRSFEHTKKEPRLRALDFIINSSDRWNNRNHHIYHIVKCQNAKQPHTERKHRRKKAEQVNGWE